MTASLEVWGDANVDPAGTVKQASFDLGAAWIPAKAPNFQLDGGVNLGLNRATPGVQAHAHGSAHAVEPSGHINGRVGATPAHGTHGTSGGAIAERDCQPLFS